MARTEEQEQIAVFEWAEYASGMMPELKLLYHIPNGGSRSISEAVRFKRAGVKRGVPDLCLPVRNNHYSALYIEMKTRTGRIRPEQKEWLEALNRAGNAAVVCRSAEEAINILRRYLSDVVDSEV